MKMIYLHIYFYVFCFIDHSMMLARWV